MSDSIKLLLSKFGSESWQERHNAFADLYSQICPEIFAEALKIMPSCRNEDISYWCVKLFTEDKKHAIEYKSQFIEVIKKLFKEKCYFIAKYYIPVLMIYGDDFSIHALIELFKSPDWKVRQECSENIIKLGPKIAPFLIKAFQNSKDRNVQYWTMKIFGKLMGAQSIDNLARACKASNYMTRYYAVIALGETEDDKAIPILIQALEDESFLIRASSFDILESMGERIFPFLEKMFARGHSNLKVSALKLFAKIKGEGSINTIRTLITDLPDRSFYMIAALSEVRSLKSMNLLIDLLLDESWEVKRYAYNQLVRFGLYTINFLRDYINHPDTVIDIELYIWFAKIMVDYPFEARDEIALLLSIHNEDILNVIIDTMNPGLVTKEVITALIPYFSHGKWTLRKKVALHLRKVGKSAIPILRDYIATSNDDNIVYWSERTLIYLGESLDSSVTKIKKNTALINKISEEMNEIEKDITDEKKQEVKKVDDDELKKKKDILKRIESIENLYLKDIARDLIDEKSTETLIPMLQNIKNFIRKNDFTFLLDLYHYFTDKEVLVTILDDMEKIYSNEFSDLIVNLYNFEKDQSLKLKILSVVRNDDSKAVIDLAFQEMNNADDDIKSFARKIYFNFNKSLANSEISKPETDDINEFINAVRNNKLKINKTEFLDKIIQTDSPENRKKLIALHEIWFADKSSIPDDHTNEPASPAQPVKPKIIEKKIIKEVYYTSPWVKKIMIILISILIVENIAFFYTGKIIEKSKNFFKGSMEWISSVGKSKSEADDSTSENGEDHAVTSSNKKADPVSKTTKTDPKKIKNDPKNIKPEPKVVKTEPKPVKTEPKPVKTEPKPVKTEPKPVKTEPKPVKTEPKPVKTEPKPVKTDPVPVKTDPSPVKVEPVPVKTEPVSSNPAEVKSGNVNQDKEINAFYTEFKTQYNSKNITNLLKCYSKNYKDETDDFSTLSKKLDNELKNLGTVKIEMSVEKIEIIEGGATTTFNIFMEGTLQDGTQLDREITETVMSDTLEKIDGSYKIKSRKELTR